MHKYSNTISNYFSLLTNHICDIDKFSKQIDFWAIGAEDLYYEALTDNIFKEKLITFPQKIIIITQEISSVTKLHLEKLHLLFNAMEVATKVERCWEK
jgi:hypothetical protein